MHGVELRLVPGRPRRALHGGGRGKILVAGTHAGGGGRTNVWGRQSYRLSDLDFKAASHDGFGEDWPLGYADLAPYYDLVEDYVGITGIAEGVYELPDSRFLPPMGMRCVERHVRDSVKKKLGWTLTLGRSPISRSPSTAASPATTAGPASSAASRIPTSTPPSRPWPTRSRPATARSSRTRWSTRCSWTP